jgi:MFS family permease
MLPVKFAANSLFKVISIKEFRHLWIAQLFSQLAMNTLIFVLALKVFDQTKSNTAVSMLFLVYAVPALFLGMIAGTLVDKLERRVVLAICDLTRALVTIGFAFFPDNLAVVYGFTFINSVITQFYVPSEAPLIPQVVPASMLLVANSLFTFTYFSSLAVGSIIAGPLFASLGLGKSFSVLALIFFMAFINVMLLKKRPIQIPFTRLAKHSFLYALSRIFGYLREGLTYISEKPSLKEALFLLLGTQVIMAILAILGPGFAVRVMEIPVSDASLYIMGPSVLGIILGALWVGNIGYLAKPQILINTGISAAGIILVLISLTVRLSRAPFFNTMFDQTFILAASFFLFFLLGVANSILDAPANSILQSHAEGNVRGRVYGMLAAGVGGIGLLPVVVGGILADFIGVGKVIFIVGIIVCAYAFVRIRYQSGNKNA